MKFSKVLIGILLVLFAIPLVAQTSKQYCSLATLNGTYGSFGRGEILVPVLSTPPPYPLVAIALHTFDGNGNWSMTYSTAYGGVIIPWGATATGIYTVSPDCELSVAGATPAGLPLTFVGPITGDGISQEADITYTDRARVQSATLRRTPLGGCSQKTLEGEYAVFGQGFGTLDNLPPLGPVAHVGTFVADGNGNFSGQETVKIADIAEQDTFTAKYAVNRNCTISAEITLPSGVLHEVGIITGVGKFQEFHFIVTDAGWVFADTAKKR